MWRDARGWWLSGLFASVALAQPALMEPDDFPDSFPGPSAVHPGAGCFWLASGSIVPDDVDWVQISIPFATTATIIDVDFSADQSDASSELRVSSEVDGSVGPGGSNIDDQNNNADAFCGLHGASVPIGSLEDSVLDLGPLPGSSVIHVGIFPFGSQSQTFDYEVWVFAVDESSECLDDVDCDDGFGCTLDQCLDGACVHDPDDTACDNSVFCDGQERCDADAGCISGLPPCPPDACDEASTTCTSLPAVLDIRPGACPNVLNPSGRGVLPVALLGTADLPIDEADPGSVRLTRADGVGGAVAPMDGPPGPHAVLVDAALPFARRGCDCDEDGVSTSSGGPHWQIKFNAEDITTRLQLNGASSDALIELRLSGSLFDGTPFVASDCLRLVPPAGRSQPVCGNGAVEAGEQCDPPDGLTCDSNCQMIPDGTVANDNFAGAVIVGEGTTPFSNVGATTDGPPIPEDFECVRIPSGGIEAQIAADVWFCYTSTCRGQVVVGLCGSGFDTKLAVYEGCAMPATSPVACSDDDCGAVSLASRVTFQTQPRRSWLIRVGGFRGAQGEGLLTVLCDPHVCGPGQGDCLADNSTRGCEDEDCCQATCQIDPFCCDVEWDSFCAGIASGACADNFPACRPDAGDCTVAGPTPGCNDPDCCNDVCLADPLCCLDSWDEICVGTAAGICGFNCGGDSGDCFTDNGTPGCSDDACCRAVCGQDPFCCAVNWDDDCAVLAGEVCP